jgi:hypothetical protein
MLGGCALAQCPQEEGEAGDADDGGYESDSPEQITRQDRFVAGAGWALHDSRFGRFEGESERKGNRRDHVDPEDLNRGDRELFKCEHHGTHHHQCLSSVGRKDEQNRFLQIIIDGATLLHRSSRW